MTSIEKAELMKSTIEQLYSKEGRSFSYISRLLNINRSTISQKIKEWNLPSAPHKRYLSPSNQKFVNKNRTLIKARLDNNVPLQKIAEELKISRDKLYRTLIPNDDILNKSYEDFVNRIHQNAENRTQAAINKSSRQYDFTDLPNEIWKEIMGYPGYYVSNEGRIKHYVKRYKRFILITSTPNAKNGYFYVKLTNENGKSKNLMLSRIVGHAFVTGFSETNNTINHENGDITNNKASNLTWQSQSKNNEHAYRKLNRTKVNFRKYKFDYILYQEKYQFKTIAAFARFIGKSETQIRRYLDHPDKHNIKLIKLNK